MQDTPYKIRATVLRLELGRPVTEEDLLRAEEEIRDWQQMAAQHTAQGVIAVSKPVVLLKPEVVTTATT